MKQYEVTLPMAYNPGMCVPVTRLTIQMRFEAEGPLEAVACVWDLLKKTQESFHIQFTESLLPFEIKVIS